MFSSANRPFRYCCSKLKYVVIFRNKSEYTSQIVIGKMVKKIALGNEQLVDYFLKHTKTITNCLHNTDHNLKKKLLEKTATVKEDSF